MLCIIWRRRSATQQYLLCITCRLRIDRYCKTSPFARSSYSWNHCDGLPCTAAFHPASWFNGCLYAIGKTYRVASASCSPAVFALYHKLAKIIVPRTKSSLDDWMIYDPTRRLALGIPLRLLISLAPHTLGPWRSFSNSSVSTLLAPWRRLFITSIRAFTWFDWPMLNCWEDVGFHTLSFNNNDRLF